MPRRASTIVLLLVVSLCGCPDSSAEKRKAKREAAWATHEPALQTLTEQLPKFAEDAAAQEKLAEARWEVSEPLDCRSKTEGHNALVVQLEDLGDDKPSYLLDLGDRGTLRTVERVRAGEVPDSISDMGMAAGVSYVLLVRVHEVRGPVIPEGGLSEFERGYVRGDVLVYDVRDGVGKGGFPFEGTNSETVKAGVDDPESWLQNDLFRATRRAIHDAIEAQGEGNQGPLGPDDRLR